MSTMERELSMSSTMVDSRDDLLKPLELTYVMPLHGEQEIDFDQLDVMLSGEDVELTTDPTLKFDMLYLGDNSEVTFPVSTDHPILVLYMKHIEKFIELRLECLDDAGTKRTFSVSNRRSNLVIKENTCSLPLLIEPGWQYTRVSNIYIPPLTASSSLFATLTLWSDSRARMPMPKVHLNMNRHR